MITKLVASAALVFIAGGASAMSGQPKQSNPALDMPEKQYLELKAEVEKQYGFKDLSKLDAGQVQWLKSACSVILERETQKSKAAKAAGDSHIEPRAVFICVDAEKLK